MASAVDLTMDAKEVPVELREGSIANNTKDGKAPIPEPSSSAATAGLEKKAQKSKEGKKKKPSPKSSGKLRKSKSIPILEDRKVRRDRAKHNC